MELDLTSFKKSLLSFENAVKETQSEKFMSSLTPSQREIFKAGVIQNFEFTYEVAWKMIQRWIKVNMSPEDGEPLNKKDLFRLAARKGLIGDPLKWFKFHEARNMTAHTYNQDNAEYVYKQALFFVVEAARLFKELERRND